MVLSASRRTDIPNYYSEWFLNRIKEGFLYVRNPWDMHQVSEIDISPSVVDCIVFWTKNPIPMFGKLEGLGAYQYYFQFTLTGYGADMELNVRHKKDVMLPAFRELSERLGKGKVIWRYDPILFSPYRLLFFLGKYCHYLFLQVFIASLISSSKVFPESSKEII